MALLAKLAWRNIWRNRRRSLLTVLAVVFAAFLSIAMRAIQVGTYAMNIQSMVRMFSGYFQVQREGYNANPTLQQSFPYDEDVCAVLSGDRRVEAFTPRVYAEGLAAFKGSSLGASIIGVDVEGEPRVTTFCRVTEGAPPHGGDTPTVALGWALARNLGVRTGDDVVLLAQGADGTLGNMRYRVSGLIKTMNPELDRGVVVMSIASAQELLAMEGRVHAVAVALHDLRDLPGVAGSLKGMLATRGLTLLTWEELLPEMRQHMQMDNISGILFLGILILIVAFGILNTILMSVTERFREFGVSLAMGISSSRLVLVVLLEAMFITLVGLAGGNLLALILNAYIVAHPISLGQELETMMQEYGWLPAMYSTLRFHVFFNSSLAILGVTALSCLYPAYRVWNLEPIQGMRHV
jgi:ABC-type lipoprotein release transport system permease subunit